MVAVVIHPRGTHSPKINSKLIEPISPQLAYNTNIESGNLKPLLGSLRDQSLPKPGELRTIYKLGTDWLSWTGTVDVVKGQIADSDDRFFFTGDGVPKQSNETLATSGAPATYPSETRELGVPKPTSILTMEILGTTDAEKDVVVVSYVYTYVTAWGEESAPSEQTQVTEIPGGQYVSLKNFINPADAHITHLRVYRVEVGLSGGAQYQLIKARPGSLASTPVWDVPIATIASAESQVFDANAPAAADRVTTDVGEVLPSEGWDTPPTDMGNLVQHMNGVLAGSTKNQVCFSEPGIVYAWPTKYRVTLDDTVVALGVIKSTVVALTTSHPYVVQGTDPARMQPTRLPFRQRCVSKRGVVNARGAVIYPSPDGLWAIDGVSAINLTENLFTETQWQALGPGNLIGFFFKGAYYGFFSGTGKGLIVTFADSVGLREFDLGVPIYGGYIDGDTNTLCLLGEDETYGVYLWEGGSELSYRWRSKVFATRPTNYAVAQVFGPFDDGPIIFNVYGDGKNLGTILVDSSDFFWLPSGIQYKDFEFEVQGKSRIDEIVFAHAPSELK